MSYEVRRSPTTVLPVKGRVDPRQTGLTEMCRTALHMNRHPNDYRLFVVTRGTLLARTADQEMQLGPGVGVLMTPSLPFEVIHEPTQGIFMRIRREVLDDPLNLKEPVNCAVPMWQGLGSVVLDGLLSVHKHRDDLSQRELDETCRHLAELMCLAVASENRPTTSASRLAETGSTICQYIRENAGNQKINLDMVAKANGWSRRQIELALAAHGTTYRDYLREVRLRMARKRLADPRYRELTISEVACSCGFGSLSRFDTAFKRAFAESPTAYRGRILRSSPRPAAGSTSSRTARR
ncbi:AraC family transcriptional regulator [Streptomyces sp. NPDC004647]|uniref:helix-turn-helix transcriptional regulator n=1 Tax=Streptomyces sp. NPDC004647 TaxID=3154671 RepID=UPI00339DE9BC